MAVWKKGCLFVLLLVGLLAFVLWYVLGGGERTVDGEIAKTPLENATVAARALRQQSVASEDAGHVLFGDFHVHTTLSVDAYLWSLPLLGGEGVHPPADACDFARYCSQLDFYALTDHAEALTPRTWAMSKESIRQCNLVHQGSDQPDTIAFTGFEWSQIGRTPDKHYGHKNVIFKGTAEIEVPARPIASPGLAVQAFTDLKLILTNLRIPFRAFPNTKPYNDVTAHMREIMQVDNCPSGVDTKELPKDCRELAATPAVLFEKLDQWSLDSIVIPHGSTWGLYTPPGYLWDKQIAEAQNDPARQFLVEVFSGHGNSEEYRSFRAVVETDEGKVCPEPSENYVPCCWRAGEIIGARCKDPASADCRKRIEKARRDYVAAGVAGHLTIRSAEPEEWGDCGQCIDCFNPSYGYRPGGSVQYLLARGNFDDPAEPRHMTLGFFASSDNHSARPGTGYKEFARKKMTDARGATNEGWRDLIFGIESEKANESAHISPSQLENTPGFRLLWFERQASFFLTGGLVAVHTSERTRDSIWKSLADRNVYGTSGDRILLWFDMLNAPSGPVPMGTELELDQAPKFRVRAAGAFKQKPGCSEEVIAALGEDRIERVCAGECYNPSDERLKITRIEVVRIVRQSKEGEPIAELIEDAWLTIPCPQDGDFCEVEFEDRWYATMGRDVLYYVRAIQEPTPAINAGGIHCSEGKCDICYGDYRTPSDDDCLVKNEERAWSSPIFLKTPKR